jgi:hypothetical protein
MAAGFSRCNPNRIIELREFPTDPGPNDANFVAGHGCSAWRARGAGRSVRRGREVAPRFAEGTAWGQRKGVAIAPAKLPRCGPLCVPAGAPRTAPGTADANPGHPTVRPHAYRTPCRAPLCLAGLGTPGNARAARAISTFFVRAEMSAMQVSGPRIRTHIKIFKNDVQPVRSSETHARPRTPAHGHLCNCRARRATSVRGVGDTAPRWPTMLDDSTLHVTVNMIREFDWTDARAQ